MLDLFSDLSLHFERFFILSEYSMKIIQWCVLALFIVFITLPLWKREKSRYLFYAGVVLRVILLAGITLEMTHQVMAKQYAIETFEVLTDFMQFLIYGYVLLASLYYVIALPYLKNKGVFFTFDLSVLLLPLCQSVFMILAETKLFYSSGDIGIVWSGLIWISLTCGFSAFLLYLFFRLFWHRKWKDLVLFYGLISAVLLYIFYPTTGQNQLQSSLKSIVIIVTAAGSFMTIDLLCALLKDKLRWRQWGTGCIVVFFLLLLNPIMNAPHLFFQFTKSEIADHFLDEQPPLSAKSAKEIAAKFVPADQNLYLLADKESIAYTHEFANDEYEVSISAFTGELNYYTYRGDVNGKELTDKEYKKKTIEFFEKSGRSVNLDRFDIVIEKEGGKTSVVILSKMSHDDQFGFATWKKGTLLEADYKNALFQLKDFNRMNLTEKDIANTIKRAYKVLDLQPAAHQITSIYDIFLDWNHEVRVTTADQSVFYFNGSTKELLNVQLSNSVIQQKKEKISDRMLMKMMGGKPEEVVKKSGSDNDKQYTFDRTSHVLNISRDIDGIYLHWRSDATIPYTVANRDRDLIYQQVLNKYQPYTIYKKQIKPVIMTNKEGERRVSWFVIIQTFGSNEREIYEVNGQTKEVHRFDR
ncbi:hypothetical protein [Bacillus sp. 179-C3.3 HS]|uniref:hypothetical protein n=1 Tax=Bacillus sp. 179-C3.3 HS TaxID=3232162 RepID=UPI00399EEAE7